MNTIKHILISVLHSAGCSQKELASILEMWHEMTDVYELMRTGDDRYMSLISPRRREKIVERLRQIDIQAHQSYVEKENIRIVTVYDTEYPEPLRHIYQIPTILYVKGNITLESISLGIVGSRKNTNYWKNVLEKIFEDIPFSHISIISGGAYGIDSLAHTLALEKWMHTIAVFGCGINITYPHVNRGLFDRILAQNGGLISAFPLDTAPESYNFPIRNEIVAWLSETILIPEAGLKSGTLITARLALELGKEVCAVPGDIFRETSQGCNHLIASGEAKCTLSVADVFEEYEAIVSVSDDTLERTAKKEFHSDEARMIFESIYQGGHKTIDQIIAATGLPVHIVTMEISLLEIHGHIASAPWGIYECIF